VAGVIAPPRQPTAPGGSGCSLASAGGVAALALRRLVLPAAMTEGVSRKARRCHEGWRDVCRPQSKDRVHPAARQTDQAVPVGGLGRWGCVRANSPRRVVAALGCRRPFLQLASRSRSGAGLLGDVAVGEFWMPGICLGRYAADHPFPELWAGEIPGGETGPVCCRAGFSGAASAGRAGPCGWILPVLAGSRPWLSFGPCGSDCAAP